ncbi:MAG: hypothetical protein QXD57_07125 [Ignisphaera sp.]
MLTIQELEEIMSEHPFLPKPRFVYMVKGRVIGVFDGYSVEIRGAAHKELKDRIAITSSATDVTVVHEMLHLAGVGEVGAYLLAPVIRAFRRVVKPVLQKQVRLVKVSQPHPDVEVYAVYESSTNAS